MQFLANNKLTHLIRTHEGGKLHLEPFSMWLTNLYSIGPRGLMYFADFRLMTLMSATNYEDKGNHAYVILANRNKIRGIRIETNFT